MAAAVCAIEATAAASRDQPGIAVDTEHLPAALAGRSAVRGPGVSICGACARRAVDSAAARATTQEV